MKKSGWIAIFAVLIVFGSMFIVPLVGALIYAVGGSDLENLLNSNEQYAQLFTIILVGVVILLNILPVVLLFAVILVPFFLKARRRKKIINEGQAAEARILSIDDTGTRINNNPLVAFTLEVQPIAATAFRATIEQTVSIIHLPSYQPGKTVNVKYMPGTNEVTIIGPKIV